LLTQLVSTKPLEVTCQWRKSYKNRKLHCASPRLYIGSQLFK